MKVWFDGSFVLNKKTGIGNYLLNLVDKISSLGVETKVIKYNNKGHIVFNVIPYWLWLNIYLYIYAHLAKPDIIIFPAYVYPLFKRGKTKYAVVIHDLAPYKNVLFDFFYKWFYILLIEFAARNAEIIITVSQTVKKEIIQQFKIAENKVKIVYNSVNESYLSNNNLDNNHILEKFYLQPKKYILTAATMNKQNCRRKNVQACMEAFKVISFRYPDIKLVLVGKSENNGELRSIQNPNIILTEYLPDNELQYLFQNALLYVFPSLYEGFGIPILEAQASGVPVIASDIDVFREVADNSVLFSNPKPKHLAKKMDELLKNSRKRRNLARKGYLNLERYNKDVLMKQIRKIL